MGNPFGLTRTFNGDGSVTTSSRTQSPSKHQLNDTKSKSRVSILVLVLVLVYSVGNNWKPDIPIVFLIITDSDRVVFPGDESMKLSVSVNN
jgi:hypothetical protein